VLGALRVGGNDSQRWSTYDENDKVSIQKETEVTLLDV
jgi:hypothetical protein